MIKIYIILLTFLFSFVVYSQTIKDYNEKIIQIESEKTVYQNKIKKIKRKLFSISGEVYDRDEDFRTIQLKGSAFPINEDLAEYGTLGNGYILIINPDKKKLIVSNPLFYDSGVHYFLMKSSAKNALGNDVPVYWYGDIPAKEKLALDDYKDKLNSLEQELKEIVNEKNEKDYEQLMKEGAVFSDKLMYYEAILKYQSAIKAVGRNYFDDSKKAILCAQKKAEASLYRNDFESSVPCYRLIIDSDLFESSVRDSAKKYLGSIYLKWGKNDFENKNYKEAVTHFEKAKNEINNLDEEMMKIFSESSYNCAIESGMNDISATKYYMKYAIKINPKMQLKCEEELNSYKRSVVLYTGVSLIPGLGHVFQGNVLGGVVVSTIIGGFAYLGLSVNNDEYFVSSRGETIINKRALYWGVGLILYSMSIYRNYKMVNNYNSQFELVTDNKLKIVPLIDKNNFGLALLVSF